jgi:hypothetical protein
VIIGKADLAKVYIENWEQVFGTFGGTLMNSYTPKATIDISEKADGTLSVEIESYTDGLPNVSGAWSIKTIQPVVDNWFRGLGSF